MNAVPRFRFSSSKDSMHELITLVQSVELLPSPHREQIEPLVMRVMESLGRRRRVLTMVQEALSQLQVEMKYLLFDLEATRRERDEALRECLERDLDDECGP
jgi:hypothetical protein